VVTEPKHAFISYVNEDAEQVDRLCGVLSAAGIPYWRDRNALGPGDEWKKKIRQAIKSGSLVFLACFSEHSRSRPKSYMNEELTLAVDEFRQHAPGHTWLIPIRFDDGDLPEWDLGAGRTLSDLNYVNLFGEKYAEQGAALVMAVAKLMGALGPDAATARAAVQEASDSNRRAMMRRLTKEMVLEPNRRIELDDLVNQEISRILTAMRDDEQFPTSTLAGTADEQIVTLAELASRYWLMVEPFCWSLQVAARWTEPATLSAWAKALQSLVGEATKVEGGNTALLHLRYLPGLCATFTAALAADGQGRWDNLKALLIDNTTYDGYQGQAPIIRTITPHRPFPDFSNWVENTLARSVLHSEDPSTALKAFTGNKVGKYHTPAAEWLHHVLRPVFDEQFHDDEAYSRAFDRAEIMLGVLSQYDQDQLAKSGAFARGSSWFGRSTWRASHGHGAPLDDISAEVAAQGSQWPPLRDGLFGGDPDRAASTITSFAELFGQVARNRW
jgi:hypothetical protein